MTIKKFFGGSLFFVFFASVSYAQELVEPSPMVHRVVDFMGSPVGAGLCFSVRGVQLYHMMRTFLQSRPYFTADRFTNRQEFLALLNIGSSATLSFLDKRLFLSTFAPHQLYGGCCDSVQCCESFVRYYPRVDQLFNMLYFSMVSLYTARYAYNIVYKSDIYPNPALHAGVECPICYEQNQAMDFITPCSNNHPLCQPCYDVMLQNAGYKKPNCPLCREKLMSRTVNYPRNIIDRIAGTESHGWESLKYSTILQLMTFTFFFMQFYHFLYDDYYANCSFCSVNGQALS